MSFTSSRASSSSPVGDLDRTVKVDFRDETNSKSKLVEEGRVRFRLTRAEGGSEFTVDLTSPSMDHVEVFLTRITEEKFSQPPYNQLGVKFPELPGFIHTMLKSAMSKDPQHFLALTIRKDKDSSAVAEFGFSTKHTVGSNDVRAHVMSLHLDELNREKSFSYWVGRAKTAEKKYAARKEMGSKSERQFCSLQAQYSGTSGRPEANDQNSRRSPGKTDPASIESRGHGTSEGRGRERDWKRLKEKEKAGALDDDVLDELKEAHEQTKAERNQWKQKYVQLKAQFQKQETERTEAGLSKVEALERENQALKERLAKLKQESEEWKLLAADQTADRTARLLQRRPTANPSWLPR
ncbi:hypothetical protein M3Y99_00758600 [Aphelenchoides fujianensis]|nr:hypothetical protein M3Y99_00758600 [Aphelenchoides fujianensis]